MPNDQPPMELVPCPQCGSGVSADHARCLRCGLSTAAFLMTTRRGFVAGSIAAVTLPIAWPHALTRLDPQSGSLAALSERAFKFAAFDPSFISMPFGHLRHLFEAAFTEAKGKITFNDNPDQTTFEAKGVLAGPQQLGAHFLNFGHVPVGAASVPRSEHVPYELTVVFDKLELKSVKLSLYLLNPSFRLSAGSFTPATYDFTSRVVTPVPGAPDIVGLELRAIPVSTTTYEAMREGLPADTFATPPAEYRPYGQSTLHSRIDLSLEWPIQEPAGRLRDAFGRRVGIPGGGFPRGAGDQQLRLYSPGVSVPFDAMLHPSRRFVLTIGTTDGNGIDLIMSQVKKPSAGASPDEQRRWGRLRLLREAFGVQNDFQGLLFGGLGAHLLDDELRGHANVNLRLGATAIAFGGAALTEGSEQAKWYTSVQLNIRNDEAKPMFGVLAPEATLDVSIAGGGVRFVSLKGTFATERTPGEIYPTGFQWLSGKQAVASLARYPWNAANGDARTDWALELAVVGSGERVLTVVDIETFGGSQNAFNDFVTTLAFGPIVLRTKPINSEIVVPASDAKTRGYFAEIADSSTLVTLFAATQFNTIFKNAITARALRVTGVYLRDQPRRINDPSADSSARETALLFDYEADYDVNIAGMNTKRHVMTRIQGTGFKAGGGRATWVQVPSGLYELSLDDPGLWNLTGLGKLLRLVAVSVRKRNARAEIVIQLRLAANFEQIKADDFMFVLGLTGSSGIEAYPSSVELDFPGALKAKGLLLISDAPTGSGKKDILGSVDLAVVPINLRVFAGVRVSEVEGVDRSQTAFIASAAVTLPTPIPLVASGVTITGFEGLFATHFARAETASSDIPPALQWLVAAKGNVVESINNKTLWKPTYARWTFALGATLAILGAKRLLNLNGLLALELPGPRVLVFSKLNILKQPVENTDQPEELIKGALGVLDIDVARQEVTLAAVLEQEFKKVLRVRAAVQLFASMKQLSNWHLYFGQYRAPVTAQFDFGGILKINGEVYFMAAGHDLTGGPWPSGRIPGFGLAYGFHSFLHIGGSALFIRVDFRADLAVSFAQHLFVFGRVMLSGEINLWIIAVGASGELALEFLKASPDATDEMYAVGRVCGSVKILFRKLKGCVSVELGRRFVPDQQLPDLVEAVNFVSAPDVVKFGQGAFRPTDGNVAAADETTTSPIDGVPIDTVIALSMIAPPYARPGLPGALPSAPGASSFNIAGVRGSYHLRSLTLTGASGASVLDNNSPCRWWANANPAAGGQALPTSLALLTKNPFGLFNAVPASIDLENLIGDPCSPALPPQNCLYHFTREDCTDRPTAIWIRPGVLCSADIESRIGRSGVSDLTIQVEQRLTIPPESSGLPLRPAMCVPELGQFGVSDVLRMVAIRLGVEPTPLIARLATGGISKHAPVRLLMALPKHKGPRFSFAVERADGSREPVTPTSTPMSSVAAREAFHENCERWQPIVESWAVLAANAQFGDLSFQAIDIDLSDISGTAVGIVMTLHEPAEQYGLRTTALLGGAKFIPLSEEQRAREQSATRDHLLRAITSLFQRTEEPLLEPRTPYTLTIAYDAAQASAPVARSQRYSFTTTAHPPRRLDPYLLAAFPMAGERFHFTGDVPGLVLTSDIVLRVLAKHNARLKVTITNDGDQTTLDSTGNDWSRGVVFDPAALVRLEQPIAGIKRQPVSAVPSAIMQQILEMQRAGKLGCLSTLEVPTTALWIGFDVVLKPLTGYHLRIEIVDIGGNAWPWPPAVPASGGTSWMTGSVPPGTSQDFYTIRFKTSLHASAGEHADALKRAIVRHRQAAVRLEVPPGAGIAGLTGVEMLPDKLFEDVVAAALKERTRRDGEPFVTMLWSASAQQAEPVAILVESNEPMVRHALVPVLRSFDGAFKLTDTAPRVFSGPRVTGTTTRTIVSSSGCSLLVLLAPTPNPSVRIQLSDLPLERVPRTIVVDRDVYVAPRPSAQG